MPCENLSTACHFLVACLTDFQQKKKTKMKTFVILALLLFVSFALAQVIDSRSTMIPSSYSSYSSSSSEDSSSSSESSTSTKTTTTTTTETTTTIELSCRDAKRMLFSSHEDLENPRLTGKALEAVKQDIRNARKAINKACDEEDKCSHELAKKNEHLTETLTKVKEQIIALNLKLEKAKLVRNSVRAEYKQAVLNYESAKHEEAEALKFSKWACRTKSTERLVVPSMPSSSTPKKNAVELF